MSDSKPSERIWTLMQEIGVAMVVTHSGDGGMRARPMSARPENDDDAVYFLSDAEYAEGSGDRRQLASLPRLRRPGAQALRLGDGDG